MATEWIIALGNSHSKRIQNQFSFQVSVAEPAKSLRFDHLLALPATENQGLGLGQFGIAVFQAMNQALRR